MKIKSCFKFHLKYSSLFFSNSEKTLRNLFLLKCSIKFEYNLSYLSFSNSCDFSLSEEESLSETEFESCELSFSLKF